MEKFKLSQHITISPAQDNYDEIIPLKYRNDFYVLYNHIREKEYLINPTIKYFIDKFSSPKSEAQVINEVYEDVKGDRNDVEETCSSFFHFLCKRKILVPEEQDETFALREPLYKPGDVVGDYTITELLANKKYLDVYTAFTNSNKSGVVIKLLNSFKARDQAAYMQELFELEREYKLLKKVSHIGAMCQTYGFVTDDKQNAYIVLEYINGKPLFDFLDETEGLTNADLLTITESILTAFGALHESKIIHGDIHSSNILVLPDKSIKIIDLGLSRTVDVEKDEILPFGGVNYYMPPERINSSSVKKYIKEPDLYSDVYQIGLLLYLVLYNDLPFEGFIWEELAQNIKESQAVYPEKTFLNTPVPKVLVEIIDICLSKHPEERYMNARYILEEFKRHALAENEMV